MRSRDGDHSYTRRLCTVVLLLSSLALNASEFLISYRYVVKDAILYNENLTIAKAMHNCQGKPQKPLLLESSGDEDLRVIIERNRGEFITYIHRLGLHVQHKEKTINYQNISTTILTLKTTCFKVGFNDNFVKISPLK